LALGFSTHDFYGGATECGAECYECDGVLRVSAASISCVFDVLVVVFWGVMLSVMCFCLVWLVVFVFLMVLFLAVMTERIFAT